jgi:hypothetical protein
MLPKWHIIISAFVFLFLYFFLRTSLLVSLFVALATVLIDIDHYFFYIVKYKEFNFKKVYNHQKEIKRKLLSGEMKKKDRPKIFLIFHSIEFFILLLILIIIFENSILYLIFISFLFHFLCDLVYGLITKMFYIQIYSLTAYLLSKRK